MAAVDREMDEHGRPVLYREAEGSLEESLESELLHDLRYGRIDSVIHTDLARRAGRTESAAGKVERTCDEIIDDAHADVLVRRVIEARDNLSVMLADLPPPREADDPPPRTDASAGFRMARAARRTALACSVAALMAGGVWFAAAPGSDVGQFLARILPQAAPESATPGADPASETTFAAALPGPEAAARPPTGQQDVAAPAIPVVMPVAEPAVASVPGPEAADDGLAAEALAERMRQEAPEDAASPGAAALEAALRESRQPGAAPPPAPAVSGRAPSTPVRTVVAGPPAETPASDLSLAFAAPAPAREAEVRMESLLSPPPAPVAGRDPGAVDRALASALGLDRLDSGQKNALKDRLVAGVCVSEALTNVIGRVPVLAMRDLVQHLDANC